jgi:hypothetical protein
LERSITPCSSDRCAGDHLLDLLGELRIVHHALEVGEVLEEIGDAEQAELRDEGRGVGRVGADHVDRAQAQPLDQLLEHLVAFVIHASERLVVAGAQPEILRSNASL